MQIRLYCNQCDIIDCPFCQGYIPYESKEGCIRELDNDLYMRYYHFEEELWPFRKFKSFKWVNTQANFFIDFMNDEVAYTPLVHKLNEFGKPEIVLSTD